MITKIKEFFRKHKRPLFTISVILFLLLEIALVVWYAQDYKVNINDDFIESQGTDLYNCDVYKEITCEGRSKAKLRPNEEVKRIHESKKVWND